MQTTNRMANTMTGFRENSIKNMRMHDYMNNSQYSSGGGKWSGVQRKTKALGMSPKINDLNASRLSIDSSSKQ